ncbi:MAG: alanine racemase [Synergistaceae bacterium]|nr:alanine racemase [Synergistaceae bacterium]
MRLRPTRMEVSLDNFRHNYRVVREYVKPSRIIAVIKADAYGMGAVPVVWALKAEGADFFGVATPDEAVELREAGIGDPVLVLGSSPYCAAETYVKLGIRSAITDTRMAGELSKAAVRHNRQAHVHIKVDSGMGRIGFLPHELPSAAEKISKLPGINIEGTFTHFATADTDNRSHVHEQYKVFSSALETLRNAGIPTGMVHCCNSGALLNGMTEMFGDAVRPGHILNGIIPSKHCGAAVSIKPCFEIKTAVGAVRELPPGFGVSYGLEYTTSEAERIAILPVGYADGFSRLLSNRGEVLIRGERCPIRGRICMDQCIVGVSRLKEVAPGDEAVLLGRQGGEVITLEDYAGALPTITATVSVSFTARMPRVYV